MSNATPRPGFHQTFLEENKKARGKIITQTVQSSQTNSPGSTEKKTIRHNFLLIHIAL